MDTRGLHALRCDHHLRDAALGRGLELALRGQLDLLRLPDHLVVFHADVCRRRFFPPRMYFTGLTRINNKVNMQGRGPVWTITVLLASLGLV